MPGLNTHQRIRRKVEKTLGHKLPKWVHFHQFRDEWVCCNRSFHFILHQRQISLETIGRPDFLPCSYCHKFDIPERMMKGNHGGVFHRDCLNQYERIRYNKRSRKNENCS